MKASAKAVAMIRHHEGTETRAYLCPAGVWTIGTGHTGPDVVKGMVISDERARELLAADLERFELGVLGLFHGCTLTQGQFDALVSFAFNVGLSALTTSTLRRKLLAGDVVGAADQFGRWVRAGGKVLPGLVRRRADERELFLS